MKQSPRLTLDDRQALDQACREIERRYPGSLAAYEGFQSPILDLSDEQIVGFHVFNVREDQYEGVYDLASALIGEIIEQRDIDAAFNIWDVEQTETYFAEDMNRLRGMTSVPATLSWPVSGDQTPQCSLFIDTSAVCWSTSASFWGSIAWTTPDSEWPSDESGERTVEAHTPDYAEAA